MEHLLFFVLKSLLKLVLYAVTGKWHDLGDLEEQMRKQIEKRTPPPPTGRARPARPVFQRKVAARATQKTKPAAREARASADSDERVWPFRFRDELIELESDDEEQGGEQPVQHHATFKRRPMPGPGKAVVAAKPRSLARALRDPHTVREAIALGAALGRRGPRR